MAQLSRLAGIALACASLLPAQHAPTTTAPLPTMHLVEYGDARELRDELIGDGGFFGDLGRWGVARLSASRSAALAQQNVPVTRIADVYPGEVLVAVARGRTGAGPLHGRLVASRRAFFLTAIDPMLVPKDCRGSGFHGGTQVLDLTAPYVANESELPAPASSRSALLGTADPTIAGLVAQVQQANLQNHVTALSAIFTRRTTRAENAQAVSYVTNLLAGLPGITFTTETFDPAYGPNIIAELPGTDLAHEIVMVGAHLDSIVGGSTSGRSPGADDNASGSAAVLEIARIFAGQSFRRTVRFAWWNAEELGLLGSEAYARAAAARSEPIVAYVNTDMNAYRAAGDSLSVDYVLNDSTTSLLNVLIAATQTYLPGVAINTGSVTGGTSDHRAFFRNGFAAAFPFEDVGQYSPFIHTSNDTVGTSANDFVLSRLITQSIVAGLAELAEIALANPARFEVFGQGCGGAGPAQVCATLNQSGGTLGGDVRNNEYAYEVPHTGTSTIEWFEVFTQSTTGGVETVSAYLYADAGNLPAATPLASTTIAVGPTAGFYRATLPAPVTVTGDFHLAIDHSAQTTVVATLTSGTSGVGYFRRPPTAGTWAASALVTRPAYRVACVGSQPQIGTDGAARVGRSFAITLARATPSVNAFQLIGFSGQSFGGIPLPLPLPAAPGCELRIANEVSLAVSVDAAGEARVALTVPNDLSLIGLEVFHQWFVADPLANPLGILVSAGAKSTIGE